MVKTDTKQVISSVMYDTKRDLQSARDSTSLQGGVLICLGCCNYIPQAGGRPQQQNFIFSQFWRLEINDQRSPQIILYIQSI